MSEAPPPDDPGPDAPTQPDAPAPGRRGWRKWLARLGCGTAVLLLVLVIAVVGVGTWLTTDSGQRFVEGQVESLVTGSMTEGRLAIGSLRIGWSTGIAADDIVIEDGEGRAVVRVDRVEAELAPWALLGGVVHLPRLDLTGVHGDLRVDEQDGTLDIARLFGAYEPADPDAPPWEGLPITLAFDAVSLRDGDVAVTGGGFDLATRDLALDVAVRAVDKRFEITGLDLSGRMDAPREGPLGLSGDVIWDDASAERIGLDLTLPESSARVTGAMTALGTDDERVDLEVMLDDLAMADVDAFVAAGLEGRYAGTLTATGPLDAIDVQGRLQGAGETEGGVRLDAAIDATTPAWKGEVAADGFRLDHLLPAVGEALPLTGVVEVEGQGSSWPDGITTTGTIRDLSTDTYGVQVDTLSSGLRLADGVLHLEDIVAAGPVGDLSGSGMIDLVEGPMVLDLRGERLDPAALRELNVPAELDGTSGSATAQLRMDLFADEVEVEVDGRLDAAPLRWTDSLVARRLGGPFQVRIRGETVTVNADATGRDVLAYGAELAEPALRRLRVDVGETMVVVTGDLELGPTRYPLITTEAVAEELGGDVRIEEGTGSFRVETPLAEGAEVIVHAEVDVGKHRLLRFPGEEGRVVVDMVGMDLTVDAGLDAGPTRRLLDVLAELDLDVDSDGDGEADAIAVALPSLQLAPLPTQTWTALSGAGMLLTDDGVTGLDVELRSSRGRLLASGQIGATGPLDLRVSTADLELSALAELMPGWLGGLDGYAGGVVSLEGSASSPVLDGDVEIAGVTFETGEGEEATEVVRGLGARLALGGAAGVVQLDGQIDVAGDPIAFVDLAVPVELAFDRAGLRPGEPVRGDVVLPPGPLDRLHRVSALAPLVPGQASGRVSVDGTLVSPRIYVAGVADVPAEGLQGPARIELHAERDEEGVTWEVDAREGLALLAELRGGGTTQADAVLAWYLEEDAPEPDWEDPGLYLGDLDARIGLQGLPIGRAVALAGLDLDIAGRVFGQARIGGSVLQPRPEARLLVEGGRVGDVLLSRAEAVVVSDRDGLGVAMSSDLVHRVGDDIVEGGLFVDGRIPVVIDFTADDYGSWVRGDLDLHVDLDVPLAAAAAYDPGIVDAHGLLEIEGGLGGPPSSPIPSLEARTTRDARFIYEPLGVQWSDLVLEARFDDTGVTLDTLQARTQTPPADLAGRVLGLVGRGVEQGADLVTNREGERGLVRASGRAAFEAWSVTDLDLRASLDRALLVSTRDQRIRMSTTQALTVTGDLAFPQVRGAVRVDEADVFLDYATAMGGGEARVDPRITVHRGGASTSTRPDETSLLDDLSIEVDVDLGRASRGRLLMPLESLQWLGSSITALARVDLRARLGGEVTYQQSPCHRRDGEGGIEPIPNQQGACGLYHPEMRGIIDILEGSARVLGADFTLADSQVRFLGNEITNPNLDIHGTMRATDATVEMDITGTAYDPEVDFRSPTHPGEAFAILLLGRSPDEVGPNELAMAAFGVAAQSVLSGLNLSAFSIDPSGSVVLGFAPARGTYVEFTFSGSPRPDENTFEAEVELTLTEGLLLRVGYGAYAVPVWGDLLFERKFD